MFRLYKSILFSCLYQVGGKDVLVTHRSYASIYIETFVSVENFDNW